MYMAIIISIISNTLNLHIFLLHIKKVMFGIYTAATT